MKLKGCFNTGRINKQRRQAKLFYASIVSDFINTKHCSRNLSLGADADSAVYSQAYTALSVIIPQMQDG